MHKLPSRIASIVAITILGIAGAAALSIFILTRALDRQALEQSRTQIEIVRDNLLERMRLLIIDYTKWDAAFDATRDGANLEWLFPNIGSAALIGEAAQLAVVWGGEFEHDLGWTDDGMTEPRTGLVPSSVLAAAERQLAASKPGDFDTAVFFVWQGDELFVVGASHFEPVEHADRVPDSERLGGLLLMGSRIDQDVAHDIAESLSLTGIEVDRMAPSDRPSLGLPGVDGKPAAHFAWDPPRPGTTILRRLTPLLSLLTLGASLLAVINMHFAKRGVQELVEAEQQASRAARTDALTGLPNRGAFTEALAKPSRAGERAILFLDINDFKRINDSIGHQAGDLVIFHVAQRLAAIAGSGSELFRIGGDEFVFVLSGPNADTRTKELSAYAEKALIRPFSVIGHQVQVHAAMGYAVQPTEDASGSDLVRQADLAMYEAKRQKGGKPVAFSAMLETATRNAALIEQGLRRALDQPGELSLAYQPITDMGGNLVRAEALARWSSPELGIVPPDEFIVVAERAGLIVQLGRELIELVCRDLVAYSNLRVSLNISPLQLMAPDFIPAIVREMQKRNIDVSRVEIELTESVIVDDTRLAAERIAQLRAAGFSIALDDFGTGYSSIGYLARLKFDTLKIDRSFVSVLCDAKQDDSVVDGMIRIAHALGLQVVSEGIETVEEFRKLKELGCDFGQGYYLDPPQSIEELAAKWLTSPFSSNKGAA